MTKTARTFLAAVLALAGQSASTAESEPPSTGPFGVTMGQHVEGIETTDDGMPYDELNPPLGFVDLTVFGTPSTGATAILLLKQVDNPDAFGNDLRAAMEEISEPLIAKYGEPSDDIDYLNHGSLWDEPREWLRGLAEGDRVKAMVWADIDADENNGVASIELDLVAHRLLFTNFVYYVRLRYWFSNHSEVEEKLNNQF